jgi:hypothetical protein
MLLPLAAKRRREADRLYSPRCAVDESPARSKIRAFGLHRWIYRVRRTSWRTGRQQCEKAAAPESQERKAAEASVNGPVSSPRGGEGVY